MPKIAPFAAYRYNLAQVGALADVVAPPYDVIDAPLQNALYEKSPYNVVRLILGKIFPDDAADNNRYTRAAKTLQMWKEKGVLQRDGAEAIYVYHQVYEVDGTQHNSNTVENSNLGNPAAQRGGDIAEGEASRPARLGHIRKGFMIRCEAVPFGEGMIYPHELTMSGPKLDRLMLTTACKMNFSQIFGLYPDVPNSENNVQEVLERHIAHAGITPLEATDHLGTLHRMWIVTDAETVMRVVQVMTSKPMFIADGHHRYETACTYRKQIAEMGVLTPLQEHPANYVLMVCIAMNDPGLLVLPTHRLLRGIAPLTQAELIAKLGEFFECRAAGEGRENAAQVWEEIETADQQETLGLFTQKDGKWLLATLTPRGAEEMDKLAADHHPEWRQLGVSILHRLVIETIFDQRYDLKDDTKKPTYVHQVSEVITELATGEYNLAALVMPATVKHIETLSLLGDRMPAKSTYFFPKLISGLVFNPLE